MRTASFVLKSGLHPSRHASDHPGLGTRYVGLCASLLLWTITFPAALDGGDRIALVVGANDYQEAPVLKNAVADSRLVAKTLEEIGFKVIALENADVDMFYQGLEDFKRLSGSPELGLVYFAGHGVEVEGKNYLLPVDAVLEIPSQLRSQTVSLDTVMRDMGELRIETKVIILDCCRDNPLSSRSWMRSRASKTRGGLAPVSDSDLPGASLILFSAAPGEVALDGTGENSPFTESLANRLREPGKNIQEAFHQVALDVMKATQKQQLPWVKADGAAISILELVLVPEADGKENQVGNSPAAAAPGSGSYGEKTMVSKLTENPASGNVAPTTVAPSAAISPAAAPVNTPVPVTSPAPTAPASADPASAIGALTTPPPATTATVNNRVGATASSSPGGDDTMKAAVGTAPATGGFAPVANGATAPATVTIPIELPSRGYFSNAEVFKGSPYEFFNDYTRRKILREAQEKLAGSGTPDGSMGKNTQSAIQNYQLSKSLPLTGLLDLATLESLALSGRTEENPPTSNPRPRPSTNYSSNRSSGENYRTGNNSRPQETLQRPASATKPKPVPGEDFIKSHAFKRITTGH